MDGHMARNDADFAILRDYYMILIVEEPTRTSRLSGWLLYVRLANSVVVVFAGLG